jgi:hypothetical protein
MKEKSDILKAKWAAFLEKELPVPNQDDDDEIWNLFRDIDELALEAAGIVRRIVNGKKHFWRRAGVSRIDKRIRSLLQRKPKHSGILIAYQMKYQCLEEVLILADSIGRMKLRGGV